MTKELTRGEKQSMAATVEAYLGHLNYNGNGSHQIRTRAWYEKRVKALTAKLKEPDLTWVRRLKLTQDLHDAEAHLDDGDVEAEFVKAAAAWGELHGIEYATWREIGVPARVLKEAGIA